MPLVKPESLSAWKDALWKEIKRSDFLCLQESVKTKDNYRICLIHNHYRIAVAHSLTECEELWNFCVHTSKLAKSGTRLVSTFESLWMESEVETPQLKRKATNSEIRRSNENYSQQEEHLIIQLTEIFKQTKKRTSLIEQRLENKSCLLVECRCDFIAQSDNYLSYEAGDILLAIEHPNNHLYYAQSLNQFGFIQRESVEVKRILEFLIDQEEDLFGEEDKSQVDLCDSLQQHQKIGSLQGWLEKRGFWLRKGWKRRWFLLDLSEERLYYYVSEKDVDQNNHRGFIDLQEITTVHESFIPDSRKKQNRWLFEIHTPQRVWFLSAYRSQEMEMWIHQINQFAVLSDVRKSSESNLYKEHRAKVLEHNISLNLETTRPGSGVKPSTTIDLDTTQSEIDCIRKGCSIQTDKLLLAKKEYPANDFSHFGAPDGEEITNKSSILSDIDRFLGHREPPDVEYIYVEPYLNYASKSVYLTANPYGHAVVRYTLPDTKEQLLMNIVGLADHELVNFLHPEDFFFSTNFDTKIGNEQGGIYNRNFVSIRIQRVPPEKILAMHQYFLDLHSRSHTNWADYNILLGPLLNRTSSVSYGNCAHWSSQGLRQAGFMKHTSMFPKAIWIDLYESLKKNCQQDLLSNNVSVVYYKRILHAKRFYGEDADWTGWGRPFSTDEYDQLESIADAVVVVPAGSKRAMVQMGTRCPRATREAELKRCKQNGLLVTEFRFDCHMEPRVLFNEIFYRRFHSQTLERTPVHNEFRTLPEHPFVLLSCGYPLFSNCWQVDHNNQLYKTFSATQSISDLIWVPIAAPCCTKVLESPKYSLLAPGEDGSCWIVFGESLFYRLVDSEDWNYVEKPSPFALLHICTVNVLEGVWVLDNKHQLFRWRAEKWYSYSNTPKLRFLSSGKNEELWGLTTENQVFRRVTSHLVPNGKWIQLHGALLSSIGVASPEEVWGVDREGRVYVWSEDTQQGHSEDVDLDDESDDSLSSMSWQSLGNILPVTTICVNSQRIPWGISDYDPGFIYKLSRHRLLILSTKSSRKIWDDRNTPSKPYEIGFWRPLPPKNFFSLGDMAERSHLENSSLESLVVCEVGRQEGEIEILAVPVAFESVWRFKGSAVHYSDCIIWRPVPPSDDYVALGHVVTTNNEPPLPNVTRCVHKQFVKQSTSCMLSREHPYLWRTPIRDSSTPLVTLWLARPRLDSLWCNVFWCSKGTTKPLDTFMYCLKLSAAN